MRHEVFRYVSMFPHVRSKYVAYAFSAVAALLIFAVLVLKVDAEVAIFNSGTYVEQGVEVVDEMGASTTIQYEYLWSDFTGIIPEGMTAHTLALRFSWSLVTRSVIATTTSVTESSETSSDSAPAETNGDGSDSAPTGESSEQNSSSSGGSTSDAEEPLPESGNPENTDGADASPTVESPVVDNPEEVLEEVPAAADEVMSDVVSPVDEPEEVAPEPSPEPPAPAESSAADTQGFESVSQEHTFLLASLDLEEPTVSTEEEVPAVSAVEDVVVEQEVVVEPSVVEETSDVPVMEESTEPHEMVSDIVSAEVVIAESVATTSGFVSSDVIVPSAEARSFDLRYSVDGATWYDLGKVAITDAQEQVFVFSTIDYNAISNLQVSARYTVPEGDTTKILFENMRVEVGYQEMPPVVEQVSVGPNDREPNFAVSAIHADVQSENIRAVLLERGGLYEFWYSLTNPESGEVVWYLLRNGGALDGKAPIAIKERTIFWIDRNQQTLFGFSVDTESIFGVSFDTPSDTTLELPFTDQKSGEWIVVFDPVTNSIDFIDIQNESYE